MPLVTTQSVTKEYGSGTARVLALDSVSLAVDRGEFVAVMGPSGCGKSTLLNLIGGLDRPSAGSVLLDGHDLAQLSDRDLTEARRKRIGFVFQYYNLLPALDARGNVALPLMLEGVPTAECDTRASAWLGRVGLSAREGARPDELSGGEQQRVAIARALVAEPALVLADEPTGNLDSKASFEVVGFLRQAADEWGRAVVMVTHDPRLAAWADRVVFLADGSTVDEITLGDDPLAEVRTSLEQLGFL